MDDGHEDVSDVSCVVAQDRFRVRVDGAATVGRSVADRVGDGREGAHALFAVSGEEPGRLVGVVPHVLGDGAGCPAGEGAGLVEDADDAGDARYGFAVEAVSVCVGVEGEAGGCGGWHWLPFLSVPT